MKTQKLKNKYSPRWLVVLLSVAVLTISMASTATAEEQEPPSMYVITDLTTTPYPIRVYEINGDDLIDEGVYDKTVEVREDSTEIPLNVAIDNVDDANGYLFVAREFSGILDLFDARTMEEFNDVNATNVSNVAGIVVDQGRVKVYIVERNTDDLYIYTWNRSTKTLTYDDHKILTSCQYAHGIALDEDNDRLYVADNSTVIKCYDAGNNFAKLDDYCFTVGHDAIGIDIDVNNQYIYTGAGAPSGPTYLRQLDISDPCSPSESSVDVGSPVLGVTVDQDTGYVYITTYGSGTEPNQIRWYDSSLTYKGDIDVGCPTGLVTKTVGYYGGRRDGTVFDWNTPDGTAVFCVLDNDHEEDGKVQFDYINFMEVVAVASLIPEHAETAADTKLEHYHFYRDLLDADRANYFWNWYYKDVPGLSSSETATNGKDSIAHGMHQYATGAGYSYWLVHGNGPHQANEAFDDCNQISLHSIVANDRLAYDDEGNDTGYDIDPVDGPWLADSVYDHVTVVTAVSEGEPTHISWKCTYSRVYSFDNSGEKVTCNTPDMKDLTLEGGQDPNGTYSSSYFWDDPDGYRN